MVHQKISFICILVPTNLLELFSHPYEITCEAVCYWDQFLHLRVWEYIPVSWIFRESHSIVCWTEWSWQIVYVTSRITIAAEWHCFSVIKHRCVFCIPHVSFPFIVIVYKHLLPFSLKFMHFLHYRLDIWVIRSLRIMNSCGLNLTFRWTLKLLFLGFYHLFCHFTYIHPSKEGRSPHHPKCVFSLFYHSFQICKRRWSAICCDTCDQESGINICHDDCTKYPHVQ